MNVTVWIFSDSIKYLTDINISTILIAKDSLHGTTKYLHRIFTLKFCDIVTYCWQRNYILFEK